MKGVSQSQVEVRTVDGEVESVQYRAGPESSPRARRLNERVGVLLHAFQGGATQRAAAAAAGVHVATVCRWQAKDPNLRKALCAAKRIAALARYHQERRRPRFGFSGDPRRRPGVATHKECPLCDAPVEVLAARSGLQIANLRFWRCSRWPLCRWVSWRPRAPWDCKECDRPCYWSHSRKSIVCGSCEVRTAPP
jgi:hypothetical protein